MAKTSTVTVHHPYPMFQWDYRRNADDPVTGWQDISNFAFINPASQNTNTIEIYEEGDPTPITEADAGVARCTITNPVGAQANPVYVNVSVGNLAWVGGGLNGVTVTVQETGPGTTYYVSSINGSAGGDGLTPGTAWDDFSQIPTEFGGIADELLVEWGSQYADTSILLNNTAGALTVKPYGTPGSKPLVVGGAIITTGWVATGSNGEYKYDVGPTAEYGSSIINLVRNDGDGTYSQPTRGGVIGALAEDHYTTAAESGTRAIYYKPAGATDPNTETFYAGKVNTVLQLTGFGIHVEDMFFTSNRSLPPGEGDIPAAVVSDAGASTFTRVDVRGSTAIGLAFRKQGCIATNCLAELNYSTGLYSLSKEAVNCEFQSCTSRYNGNKGSNPDGDRGGIGIWGDDNIVNDCDIHDNGDVTAAVGVNAGDSAINFWEARRGVATNNRITNCVNNGIRSPETQYGIGTTITGNTITNWGIVAQRSTDGSTADRTGIEVTGWTNGNPNGGHTIENNVLVFNATAANGMYGIAVKVGNGYYNSNTRVFNNSVTMTNVPSGAAFYFNGPFDPYYPGLVLDQNEASVENNSQPWSINFVSYNKTEVNNEFPPFEANPYDSGAPPEYLHDFNVSLDGGKWTYTRAERAWGLNKDLEPCVVQDGIPVYTNTGWDGSAFVADPAFHGLLLEPECMNYVPTTSSGADFWTYTGIEHASNETINGLTYSTIQTLGTNAFKRASRNISTGFEMQAGRTFFTAMIIVDTPGEIAVGGSNIFTTGTVGRHLGNVSTGNTATYDTVDWVGIRDTGMGAAPGSSGIVTGRQQVGAPYTGGTFHRSYSSVLTTSTPAGDRQKHTLLGVYVADFPTSAPIVGDTVNGGFFNTQSGPRPATTCTSSAATLGQSDYTEFCSQVSVYFHHDSDASVSNPLPIFTWGDATNGYRLEIISAAAVLTKVVGGSDVDSVTLPTVYAGYRASVKMVFKVRSSATGIKLWVDDAPSAEGTDTQLPTFTALSAEPGNYSLNRFRMVESALSDQEIVAWE